jgi:soluble lytic murein transglycosylase-like protein
MNLLMILLYLWRLKMKTTIIILLFFIFSLEVVHSDNGLKHYQNAPNIIKLAPPNLQIFYYMQKYSNQYEIPWYVIKGVARLETGYTHPLNSSYNPYQISTANARGPMQLLPSTARYISSNKSITNDDVLYNIEFNVKHSAKYLRYLHNRYQNWSIVLGYYNTGYPKINDYALKIMRSQPIKKLSVNN